MIKAFLKPDGFTVAEVEGQIRFEFYTWNRSQNRRIRTARTHAERLYWWHNHVARRLERADRLSQVMRVVNCPECGCQFSTRNSPTAFCWACHAECQVITTEN